MAAFHGASFSSSSSFTHDVFLSFRGKDTRNGFTAHLYNALCRNGINTFMDNSLRGGEEISPVLLKAIEDSKISIIVLSKNYASSRWCLDELMKILDCRKTREHRVLPLFYDVTPSEVRHQTNTVGEAFAELEKWYKDDENKVKAWKTALTELADLSGRPLENRNEPEFIHEIIKWVDSILVKKTYFQVAHYPIEIESRVQDVKSLLDIEKKDSTHMLGIFGTGGIGKTTLAKAIYNSIASQFEGNCFLGDIKETSEQNGGLVRLQNELLFKILESSSIMVDNVDQGINLIKKRFRLIRVLLVLDDVDQSVQLEKLAGKTDWFGIGSRIIITTRNKDLLSKYHALTYEVKELGHDKALQLFSWHAFNRDRPDDDYVKITKDAVRYSGGLPLALTVIGSTLKGRDILYWKSKLDEYKIIPHGDIQKKLRISFDGLDENAKNTFLDIACFFKGENVENVTKVLDNIRGFHSYSSIEELKDKCLVTQYDGSLQMHDLLQEMGREIVRQESPNEPGKRSRLWFHKDVRDVLEGNTGTNTVEGMLIRLPKPDLIHLTPKAFKKMKRLKIFINNNAFFFEEPTFLSNELRLLDWPNYPGESLPPNFCGKNLVVLKMPGSHLKELEGIQNFQNMKIMNFSYCQFLRKIPDVSRIPNLEELDLNACKNLVDVHPSVGFHDKLISLRLEECSNLMNFPRRLKMRSLELLSLWRCSRLKNFPEIECQMECLVIINFRETGIEELPSSIGYLTGLKFLDLSSCTNLMDLPYSILKLQHLEILHIGNIDRIVPQCLGLPYSHYQLCHLERLNLSGCSKVIEFLNVVENTRQSVPVVVSIEEYEISPMAELLQLSPPTNTSDSNYGCFSTVFPKLRLLDLENCDLSKSNFFRTFDCCSTLAELNLSRSDIVTLPPCIGKFVRLKTLDLIGCKALKEILGLPPNVKRVVARECVSLAIFLEEDRRSQLFNTPEALFQVGTVFPALILGNHVLAESDFLIQRDYLSSLEHLDLSSSAIVSLPAWFNKFVGLEILDLNGCNKLGEVSELPPNIKRLYAEGCTSLERFQFNNVKDLPMLEWIDFSNCHGLRENMEDDLEICLMSLAHSKNHEFGCAFPGNKISDYFSYHKEVSNANSCEIDIKEPVHLDLENTRFSFSAVIGTGDIQDVFSFYIFVELINDIGKKIFSQMCQYMGNPVGSHVVCWNLHGSRRSQLKTNNLRVKFTIMDIHASSILYFKSCGFQIVAGQ